MSRNETYRKNAKRNTVRKFLAGSTAGLFPLYSPLWFRRSWWQEDFLSLCSRLFRKSSSGNQPTKTRKLRTQNKQTFFTQSLLPDPNLKNLYFNVLMVSLYPKWKAWGLSAVFEPRTGSHPSKLSTRDSRNWKEAPYQSDLTELIRRNNLELGKTLGLMVWTPRLMENIVITGFDFCNHTSVWSW